MSTSTFRSTDRSRRHFMEKSAQTFLGVGALGMTSRSFASSDEKPAIAKRERPAKQLIYLYMGGGMSHLDTWDPKPGHANQATTQIIQTKVDGISVSEHLPSLAAHADKLSIVRSLTSNAGAHDQGNYLMHTSYEQRGTIKHPGLGAWALKFKGKLNETLPGSVYIGGSSQINGGGGFFEPQFEPLAISSPENGLRNASLRGVSQDQFNDRMSLANQFDQSFHEQYDLKRVRAYTAMYEDAIRLMKSEDLRSFDIQEEDQATRDAYGDHPFGQGCLLARRLIENNVRSVEVSMNGWDMHKDLFTDLPERCAILDQAMSALLNDLEERGRLKDTLVVLTTEFGRTPRVNQNEGRDHYPKAFSSVLAGGGVKGGFVYGKTDEGGEKVIENAITIPDFNATIAHALGLPLDQVLYSPSKRPFTVAHKGVPIGDLFA